jgi:hypothetical protein
MSKLAGRKAGNHQATFAVIGLLTAVLLIGSAGVAYAQPATSSNTDAQAAGEAEAVAQASGSPTDGVRPYFRFSIGLGYTMTWGFYQAPVPIEENFRGATFDFALSLGVLLDEKVALYAWASEKIAPFTGSSTDEEGLEQFGSLQGTTVEFTTIGAGVTYLSPASTFSLGVKAGAVRRRIDEIYYEPEVSIPELDALRFDSKEWGVEFEIEPGASVPLSDRVALGPSVGIGGHVIPSDGDSPIYGWHLVPRIAFEIR